MSEQVASIKAFGRWYPIDAEEVTAAQQALNRYRPNSPFWDSDEGQEAIAVIRAMRLERGECDHEWAYTGSAYGGDDDRWHGEGRCYCIYCGEDGDG